jgi:hypothetical protein
MVTVNGPGATLVGVTDEIFGRGFKTATLAEADISESATLVALRVTGCTGGGVAGAV